MDSNKIISEWRGVDDDYDSLKAWTPELYREIEDRGLRVPFLTWLHTGNKIATVNLTILNVDAATKRRLNREALVELLWLIATSTPAQKSEALARAIMEVSQ